MNIFPKIINDVCTFSLVLMLMAGCTQSNTNRSSTHQAFYSNSFPLSDVQLLDGPFKHARDLNIEVLLEYDVDRLAGRISQRSRPGA